MLIDGEKINVPYRREITFPRPEGDIVFTAETVSITEHFDRLCPSIDPKIQRDKDNNVVKVHYDDPKYIAAVSERQDRKFDLQVIKSLTNVTWDTVDLDDPTTWKNWKRECLAAGLSDFEVIDLVNKVIETMRPTAALIKEQRESFLAMKDQEKDK